MAISADTRHYRTWRNRVLLYPFGVLAAVLGLAVAGAPVALPVRIPTLAGLAFAFWLIRRGTHVGLEVGTKGIEVYGPFRTQHVSWDQVAGLGTYRWFANKVVELDLSDGRKLETNLIQGALVTWTKVRPRT
jgi:hypothetical protein